MKTKTVIISLIAILLISSAQASYPEGLFQYVEYQFSGDIDFGDTLDVIKESLDNGLDLHKAFDRAGTQLYCPVDYPPTCSNQEYILYKHHWESGCRGYSEDCCVQEEVNCRDVMLQGELAAQYNVTLMDKRELCIEEGYMPNGDCERDSDCEGYVVCPSVLGGPQTPMCNTEINICYCGGQCGDSYCDLGELLLGLCPSECTDVENDSDFDGLSDMDEIVLYGTNEKEVDSDFDGLEDWQEVKIGSDPNDPDTDNGGQCDGPFAVAGVCRAGPDPCPFDAENQC
jgi:hypothetical protein